MSVIDTFDWLKVLALPGLKGYHSNSALRASLVIVGEIVRALKMCLLVAAALSLSLSLPLSLSLSFLRSSTSLYPLLGLCLCRTGQGGG